MAPELRLAFLASGEGTTLEGVALGLPTFGGPPRAVGVVADRPGAGAIARARRLGLATLVRGAADGNSTEWWDAVTDWLHERGVGLVVLAGFLDVVPPTFLTRWRGRVINVHPSLLPSHGGRGMYGRRVHESVLRSGERITGATVHVVTSDLDRGPILAQRRIPVEGSDTPDSLRERLRPIEVALLLEVIENFGSGAWPLPYEAPPSGDAVRDGLA